MAQEVDRGNSSPTTLSDILQTTNIPLKELAQEVFNRINNGALDTAGKDLNAALLGIAEHAAKDWQAQKRAESRESARHEIIGDPSDKVNLEFSQAQLEAAMKKLTPRQHELMHLYIAEGLTSTEIADRQKLPHEVVRRTLGRAYAKLLVTLAHRSQ